MPRRWSEREIALPDGNWRLDPFTRIVRFVPDPPPPPKRPRRPKPCGTVAAYQRHLYRGETPCELCVTGNRDARRKQRITRAAQAFRKAS